MVLTQVLVGAWMCLVVASSHLDLQEGDACKEVNGTRWLCKNIKDCPKVTNNVKAWESNQVCQPKGRDVIVCCEPAPVGEKAKQMCKKYAEAVFPKIPDPLSENSFSTVNLCSMYTEPLITGSGGDDAGFKEFPHMALIGYGNANSIDWLCGGSLISDRFVLSAAHCSMSRKGSARWVRLGEYNFRSKDDEEKGWSKPVDYEIVEIVNHPSYDSSRLYNDIVLYKLNTTVVFDEYIRPLCLHTEYDIPEGKYLATGWGITKWRGKQSDILQKMKLLISSSSDCKIAYNSSIGDNLKDGIDDRIMICAGDVAKGINTCLGDSGGPLQVSHPDVYCMYIQFGITSFGSLCAGNRPGVYTRVSHYIPWIESVAWP